MKTVGVDLGSKFGVFHTTTKTAGFLDIGNPMVSNVQKNLGKAKT